MKIGILGTGNIGKTLALRLSQEGHDVKVANSRGPETIGSDVLANGAWAATSSDAIKDVEVVITSIPFSKWPEVGASGLLSALPSETVLIDTSNYYPHRDGHFPALDQGQVEGPWVEQQIGHPLVKAWNAIYTESFLHKATARGSKDRIALPVAGDRDQDRKVACQLVNDTGFDAYDAGSLAESWRQQPGAPCYCTDLTLAQLPDALAKAEKHRLPKRRDLLISVLLEKLSDGAPFPPADMMIALNRIIEAA